MQYDNPFCSIEVGADWLENQLARFDLFAAEFKAEQLAKIEREATHTVYAGRRQEVRSCIS